MTRTDTSQLSRRERQIMDVIWSRRSASAAEILEALPDPPSYSAVRALLGILVQKGHLNHTREGRRYVYKPTVPAANARKHAVSRLLDTFFDNSAASLIATLLNPREHRLTPEERSRIEAMINQKSAGDKS